MKIVVQKFGGTSVANTERIKHVAELVKKEVKNGNNVAVVVSAMAGTTNQLVGFANEVSSLHDKDSLKEYDSIVASGEQVTAGLLALTLQEQGIKARSWLGWQLGLETDSSHSKARIANIKTDLLKESFKEGKVAVIAGFQGVADDMRISTLGRGGSDTSAVAIAAALKADRCDIYTDVDGIYTSDPRMVKRARKLNYIAYEEMLEMASQGAKVLQLRSVEMAMKHNVVVRVLSSFENKEGTYLVSEEEVMERRLVTGVTANSDEAQITLTKVANHPGIAASVFDPLAKNDINVDMIIQNITEDGTATDITFTVPRSDCPRVIKILEENKAKLQFDKLLTNNKVAKISVIGVGMRSHAGLAQKMFQTLADKNINILVITTSEIKVSVLVDEEYAELAARSLHTAYELDNKEDQ